MPIYEYDCPKCGVIEVTQSITEPTLTKCPNCRRKVKRLISLNNFVLKGTGWYATDYAKKSDGPNGGAKGKETEKKSESKSESPAKSSESKKTDTSNSSTKSAETKT